MDTYGSEEEGSDSCAFASIRGCNIYCLQVYFLLMSSSVAPLLASEILTLEGAIVPHWIGGKAIARQGDRRAPVYNPATGQVARFVPFASKEEVGAALSAASAPFPSWSAVPPLRPAPVLFPLQQLVYGLQRL